MPNGPTIEDEGSLGAATEPEYNSGMDQSEAFRHIEGTLWGMEDARRGVMTDSISMFDMVRRQTLAALWFEAENLVHGNTACLYEHCPHAIDMCDLLTAVSRVHPPLYEDNSPPVELAN